MKIKFEVGDILRVKNRLKKNVRWVVEAVHDSGLIDVAVVGEAHLKYALQEPGIFLKAKARK